MNKAWNFGNCIGGAIADKQIAVEPTLKVSVPVPSEQNALVASDDKNFYDFITYVFSSQNSLPQVAGYSWAKHADMLSQVGIGSEQETLQALEDLEIEAMSGWRRGRDGAEAYVSREGAVFIDHGEGSRKQSTFFVPDSYGRIGRGVAEEYLRGDGFQQEF